jgi:peptidoglycan/LPS O-acetylase OafA/YrhL
MPTSPKTSLPPKGRLEALDLLRVAAVFAVMLFHFGFRGAAEGDFTAVSLPLLEPIAKYGYLGVQLFFVISGFVIAYSADGRTLAGFAIARVARIYPGFLFCMTVTCLLTVMIGAPRFETSFGQWLANTLIVAPALKQPFMDAAYWSIVYEITFYAWVAFFVATGIFRRRIDLIILVWLALSLLNEAVFGSRVVLRILLSDESAFFAAGLLLYEIYTGRRDRAVQGLLALAVATAAAQSVFNLAWMRSHFPVPFDDFTVVAISIAAIAAVAIAVRIPRLPFRPGLVVALGAMTYPLYLLHQHIGYMAFNRLGGTVSPAVLVPAVMAAVAILAFATWRYVERPAQRMMKNALTKWARAAGLKLDATDKSFANPTSNTDEIGSKVPRKLGIAVGLQGP